MASSDLVDRRLEAIRRTFPAAQSLRITSDRSSAYNCIAWVMGDATRVWWPSGFGAYWPPGMMQQCTREAFRWCFAGQGYEPCANGALEPGVEKICLYEKGNSPTHAARQLASGRWTSKIGPDEDIEHELSDLAGTRYGRPAAYFARPRTVVMEPPGDEPDRRA